MGTAATFVETPLERTGATSTRRAVERRWLAPIILCYVFSGLALDTRDPLASSLGWYVYLQLSLFAMSVILAVACWSRHGARMRPPLSFWLLSIVGLLTVLSSVRSFWPLLSVVKGCLFCFVVILAEILCATFESSQIVRTLYYSIVFAFILAIFLGLILPDKYPLFVSYELERQRLALFAYDSGDFGYMTGLAFLVGGLPKVQAPWHYQVFLFFLTIAGGSRACTVAVISIWLIAKLLGIQKVNLRFAAACVFASSVLAIAIGIANKILLGITPHLYHSLESFYGSGALAQSPLELSGRLELWTAAEGLFGQCVLLGFGFDGARDQLLRLVFWAGGPHNGLLDLLMAAGGPGLILFLTGWISLVRRTVNQRAGYSLITVHAFLLIVAGTGPAFTAFQYLGIFVLICSEHLTQVASNQCETISTPATKRLENLRAHSYGSVTGQGNSGRVSWP